MFSNKVFRPAVKRFAIVSLVSLGIIFIASEAFYLLQKETHERAPQQVELVIPLGAAEMVSRGETVTAIPEEMVFMVGDTLVVKNEDSASHQLGPLYIPANSSASLSMDTAARYIESCSFQASQYLGLDVRQPATLGTRLQALVIAGPGTIIFLFIYSLLVFPLEKESRAKSRWARLIPGRSLSKEAQVSAYARFSAEPGAEEAGESENSARTGQA
jgi:hypothetical protein